MFRNLSVFAWEESFLKHLADPRQNQCMSERNIYEHNPKVRLSLPDPTPPEKPLAKVE